MNTVELPEGFKLSRGWADAVKLETLIETIPWRQQTIRMFGRDVLQPRLTAWMGDAPYTYSGRRHEPGIMPPLVETLRCWLEGSTGARFNSVLANLYRNGEDSVSWHADDEPELGAEPVIASLSFGATRAFKVRTPDRGPDHLMRAWTLDLEHGDLLVMSGRSQADYQHSVPKVSLAARRAPRPIGPRVNLTFRQIG